MKQIFPSARIDEDEYGWEKQNLNRTNRLEPEIDRWNAAKQEQRRSVQQITKEHDGSYASAPYELSCVHSCARSWYRIPKSNSLTKTTSLKTRATALTSAEPFKAESQCQRNATIKRFSKSVCRNRPPSLLRLPLLDRLDILTTPLSRPVLIYSLLNSQRRISSRIPNPPSQPDPHTNRNHDDSHTKTPSNPN